MSSNYRCDECGKSKLIDLEALQAKADMCDRLAESLKKIDHEIEPVMVESEFDNIKTIINKDLQSYNEMKEKNDG